MSLKMADIAKCRGIGCGIKDNCYRYLVKSDSYWQSYVDPTKSKADLTDGCEYYWDNDKKNEKYELD